MFRQGQEDNISNRILRVCVVISWWIALFMLALYVYGQFVDKHDVLKIGSSRHLAGEWNYVTSDGKSGTCTVPDRLDIPVGVSVELTSVLPDDITDGDYMMVMAGRDLRLYIDDELRLDHNQSDSHIPGKIVKSGFFPVELTAADAGKNVRLVKDEADEYNGSINDIRYGDMYAITRSIMAEYAFRFFAAVLLLILGLAICIGNIVVSVVYRVIDKALRTLGFGFLVTACWLITDSYMYQFAFGNIYIDGVIGYMLTPLIPISFVRYINELQERRYEKAYTISIVLLLIDELTVCMLHFTGIRSFDRTLYFNNGMVALVCLMTFVILIIDYRAGYLKEYKWVAVGLCGLIVFGIIEIACINLHIMSFIDVWFTLGIYFLLISALIHTVGDVFNKEKERRKAVEANMVKTNFLANMSHEIRTPINAIMGMNEMILRESDAPQIIEYAGHIDRAGKLLLSIIGDVLDISKIESGKLNITNDPYKLTSLIVDGYELMKKLASDKSLEVRFEVDKDMPSVLDGDENHIKQIVINLITNAAKYTKKGYIGFKAYATELEEESDIPTTYDSCMLNIEISDSGIGIKKDDIPKLFETFERVDSKMNRNIQGTGLGLSIVKSLVEAMGGKVDVKSQYGKGSTFTVSVPQRIISMNPIGDSWKEPAANSGAQDDRNKYKVSFTAPDAKILSVDDNSSNLLIIKQFLKDTQVRVELTESGEEAIRLAQDNKYDVILLDHMMPDPDGIEVLKRIKSEPLGPNIRTPVIVLTANATQDSREGYLKAGFDDYLSKPVDGTTLEQILMKYLPKEKIKPAGDDPEALDFTDVKVKTPVIKEEKKSEEVNMDNTAPTKENNYNGLFEREDFAQVVKVFGNKDFAFEIIHKVAEDSLKSLDILKEDMEKGDYADYAIKAHGIKGMMASVYYEPLRARSKDHEMAAKEGRYDFIKDDYEGYSKECREFCKIILGQEI